MSDRGSALIEFRGVTVRFGERTVLDSIDFVVEQGDFVGIIGPNAGGKTTLLKVMLGLVKPDEGEVLTFGTSPREARGSTPGRSRTGLFHPGLRWMEPAGGSPALHWRREPAR